MKRKAKAGMSSEEFNSRYPVGTVVRYWPIRHENGKFEGTPVVAPTRSAAWNVGSGTPVVAIEGKVGGLSLAHLEIVEDFVG
jgi:hypothetical protein